MLVKTRKRPSGVMFERTAPYSQHMLHSPQFLIALRQIRDKDGPAGRVLRVTLEQVQVVRTGMRNLTLSVRVLGQDTPRDEVDMRAILRGLYYSLHFSGGIRHGRIPAGDTNDLFTGRRVEVVLIDVRAFITTEKRLLSHEEHLRAIDRRTLKERGMLQRQHWYRRRHNRLPKAQKSRQYEHPAYHFPPAQTARWPQVQNHTQRK